MLARGSNLNQESLIYPKDWGQGSRGCFAGGGHQGEGAWTPNIDYITISTPSNSTHFGTATTRGGAGGTSGRGRGLIIGGHENTSGGVPTVINTIRYVTIATTSNATDFGDLTRVTSHPACVSNGTRAVVCGGESRYDGAGGSNFEYHDMTYLTIATPGNAISFGNFWQETTAAQKIFRHGSTNYQNVGATGNGTYGMFKCGDLKYYYISIAAFTGASLFGNLSGTDNGGSSAHSNGTRAIWNSGGTNIMEYFTWSTPGNAAAFGRDSIGNGTDSNGQVGVSDNSRAVLGAGHSYSDNMMYFSMDGTPVSTLIGAVFGDLAMPYSITRQACASFAGD
jgi:hypothetical protein